MKRASVPCFLIVLCWLSCVTPAVNSQTKRRNPNRPSGYLYQVSSGNSTPGELRVGFIDRTGKLVIDFDRLPKSIVGVGEFHDGRAVIYVPKQGDVPYGYRSYHAGYIDQTGAMVIPPRFDSAHDFSEGLAYVEVDAEGFKGFIDREGRVVIKTEGRRAKDFHEGLAATESSDQDKWGYIDRAGTWVVKPQFGFADDFSENLAGVAVDRKYGFIDKKGRLVIRPRFDVLIGGRHPQVALSSGRFREGLACVRLEGLFGYINRRGDFAIPPRFGRAQEFSEGLAWVVIWGRTNVAHKVGWIDKLGRWSVTRVQGRLLETGFPGLHNYANADMDWRYSDGLVRCIVFTGENAQHGYMDRKGNFVIRFSEFVNQGRFTAGIARVKFYSPGTNENYGYIDKRGRFIWHTK